MYMDWRKFDKLWVRIRILPVRTGYEILEDVGKILLLNMVAINPRDAVRVSFGRMIRSDCVRFARFQYTVFKTDSLLTFFREMY